MMCINYLVGMWYHNVLLDNFVVMVYWWCVWKVRIKSIFVHKKAFIIWHHIDVVVMYFFYSKF